MSDLAAAAAVVHDLRALLARGFPLGEALRTLASDPRSPLVEALDAAADRADEGATFSAALTGGDSPLASPAIRALLEAGEQADRLLDGLGAAERLLARVHELRARALGALLYPLLLFPLAALLTALTVTLAGPTWLSIRADFPGWPGAWLPSVLVDLAQVPALTWAVAVGAGLGSIGVHHALGRALERWPLAGAGPFPPPPSLRQAMASEALAAQLAAGTPAPRACTLLGVWLDGAQPALAEGQPLGQALGPVLDLSPRAARALDHAATCGTPALLEELREIGAARQRRFVARAESMTHLLEWSLLGLVGLGALLAATQLVFSSAWAGGL